MIPFALRTKIAVYTASLPAILLAMPVFAAPVTFFNTIPQGRDYFDQQVTDATGTLYMDALSGLASGATSWTRTDFTITPTNGVGRTVNTSRLNPAPTGLPGGDAINMTADGTTASGLTFSFANPINGFGIELDDWATCCYPSSLYISFDGGTPILIGTAASSTDNPGTAAGQGAKTFIGTIDDSGTFSVVTFYGTGNGDVLNAGGIIRYAIVPLGAISNPSGYKDKAADTPSQGYADYFDGFDDTGPRAAIASYLDTASQGEVVEALKTIFPVNTSVTSQTMLSSSGQTANTLIEKVGTVLGSVTPVASFAAPSTLGYAEMQDPTVALSSDPIAQMAAIPYQKFETGEHALWIEGVGAGADGRATSAALGYDTYSTGVVAGWEISPSEDHMVGILASAFRSKIMLNNDAGDTDSTNYNIGLYGQKLLGSVKVTAMASVGHGSYDTKRNIDIAGVNARPEADYAAKSAGVTFGASRLYEHEGYQIEPFVMAGYTAVKTNDYSETGGGAFNMEVSGDRFSTVSARTGVTLQHTTALDERPLTFKVKPYIGQQWEIESAGNQTGFVGAGSATTVNGRDLTVFEGGMAAEVKYDFSDQTSVKFGADISKDKFEERLITYLGVGYKF